MSSPYPRLFEPITLNRHQVRNRIVSSAHGTLLPVNNEPSERLLRYQLDRAKGGAGMIVLEACRVHPSTVSHTRQPIGFETRVIPAYKRVADALHEEGASVFSQILHQGRQVVSIDTRQPLLAPSAIPCPVMKEVPKPMSKSDIAGIVAAHALTAANLKESGLDGIEIHAAHGYLIQGFLSPWSNTRTDEYGGSLENRIRFATEVIDAVRAAVGPDFTLGIRISVEEFTVGGLTMQDMQEIAPKLVARGIDYISASQSTYSGYSYATMIPDMHFAPAPFSYLAAAIKEACPNTPVIAVGRIIHPDQAERILTDGAADMVTMTRALLADPELPRKAMEGRAGDIRTCISSTEGCVGMVHSGRPITCTVNPTASYETEWGLGTLTKVASPRKVVVVGGGPAGMEAARVAAVRGHSVSLYERSAHLGGQVATAVLARNRAELGGLTAWLERQIRQLGVDIHTGAPVSSAEVAAAGADAVVIATGSSAQPPNIAGLGGGGPALLDVSEALRQPDRVGKHVLVLDNDRHYKAAGPAEFFHDQGHDVTIATMGGETGSETIATTFTGMRVRLGQKKIRALPFHGVSRVEGKNVVLAEQFSGFETVLENVDTIVWAGPHASETSLAAELEARGMRVLTAGDCVAPRRMLDAMRMGHQAGREV